MEKILILIILVNIEITIIQTIIIEFENMYLSSMSLPKTLTENFEISPQKIHKMVKKKTFKAKIMYKYVSSCSALSIKHL